MTTTLALRRVLALPMAMALALAMAIAAALPASATDPADPIPGVTLTVTLKGAGEGDDVWQTADGTVYLEADKDYVVEYSFTNDRAGDTVAFASDGEVVGLDPSPDDLGTASGEFEFTAAADDKSGTVTVTVARDIEEVAFETAITIDVAVVEVGAAEAFNRVEGADSDLVQQFGVATLTGDGETVDLVEVRRTEAGVKGTIVVDEGELGVVETDGAITVTLVDGEGTATEVVDAINDAEDIDVVAVLVDGAAGDALVTGPTDEAATFVLEPSEVVFAAFRADGVTIVEPTPAAAPAAPAPAPAESPVTTVTGSATFVDASGNTVPATVSVSDGTMTVTAGGLTAAISGDRGATATAGPVAAPSGTISATITGAVTAGGVVEARLFSTPRLVAAARSDGSGTLTIDLPLAAPLDGGDPIPAGTHTMQLLIPTASGVVAMNVGVTVGGPVPASVPAGEGQVPTAPFAIAALLAVGATALVGRRTLVAPTA